MWRQNVIWFVFPFIYLSYLIGHSAHTLHIRRCMLWYSRYEMCPDSFSLNHFIFRSLTPYPLLCAFRARKHDYGSEHESHFLYL